MGDVPATLSLTNLLGLTYMAVIGTAMAFGLWFYAIQHAGAPAVVPYLLLIPIVAFALDAAFMAVIPTPMQTLGAAIVIASLFVAQRSIVARPASAGGLTGVANKP
jgi:probable blue pigment (indigoidine) exporter